MIQTRTATTLDEGQAEVTSTHRLFSTSMIVSGIRCALTYVLLPFATPILGIAPGVGPSLGIAVGALAILANLYSIKRFWRADHRWKKQVTAIHIAVIALMIVLIVLDLRQLMTS